MTENNTNDYLRVDQESGVQNTASNHSTSDREHSSDRDDYVSLSQQMKKRQESVDSVIDDYLPVKSEDAEDKYQIEKDPNYNPILGA